MTYAVSLIDHAPITWRLNQAAQPIEQHGQAKGFRASSLSGCLRQVGYRMAGTPTVDNTYNPDYEMAAAQGTILHEHIQRQLVAAGMVYDYPGFGPSVELPLSKCTPEGLETQRARIGFSGHIDAVVKTNDGALAIFDLKTVESKYLTLGYPWLGSKLQSYAIQVSSYMYFFATPGGQYAHDAYILMVSRDNTTQRRLYRIPWQPERFNQELARLEAAVDAVAHGELPVPEPERGCHFCGFRSLCPAGK